MKRPIVLIVTEFCDVDGERYRCAKLEDETYVLIKGDILVVRRQPLPIDSAGKIDEPCDLATLRDTWDNIIEVFEDCSDHESVNKLRETWNKFEREATAVRRPKRVPKII
jgi:hypothetical protein